MSTPSVISSSSRFAICGMNLVTEGSGASGGSDPTAPRLVARRSLMVPSF